MSKPDHSRDLPRIRQAIYGQPWCITDQGLDLVTSIFERACSGEMLTPEAISAMKGASGRSKLQVVGSTAVIPIQGPIFGKANLFTEISGATSLSGVESMLAEAMDNDDVETVLFEIDSPGGQAIGLAEVASAIYGARGKGKDIVAIAAPLAASAAYWLGSQAEDFVATESAMVGSIGVVSRFASDDRMMRNAGVDPVTVKSSELKAMSAGGELSVNQLDDMKRINLNIFDAFKTAVMRGRPGMDIEKVATGQVWIGSEAVELGLVDGIGSVSDFF